ncbi:MAG: magnesium transporter [Ruminococcus sp.]|nr:magnesium transporter [Ruminococcus sp.]
MNKVLRRGGLFATVKKENFTNPQVQNADISISNEADLYEPVQKSIIKRLPWLMILLLLGTGVSAVVGLFESIVAQLPIIMCFQSLILDMSGNVGTQSLAVAIRVLMSSDVSNRKKLSLVMKECNIGLINGAILGVLSFLAIGVYLCIAGNSTRFAFSVSMCLGISMVISMAISSFTGTIIPVVFQKIGIDPAVASGPLITTVNDMVAVVTYYGFSLLILIRFLHL